MTEPGRRCAPATRRSLLFGRRDWEDHDGGASSSTRRFSPRVGAQQLMVFEFAALGTVLLNQVARELDVSLMGVYLARHRVAKLFGAEVNAAAGDGVVLVNAS